MSTQDYIVISGNVEGVVYSNQDTGFTVLDISVDNELVCAVGQMLSVAVGEELKLTGYFTTHPTFGKQFKVQMYERSLPATSHAICKYLASGIIKGIGPSTARRIVDAFGDDTLKIIEDDPMRLVEVKGITKLKAEKLAEDFKKIFGIRTLMLFLSKQGITPMQSVQVYKKWGVKAIEIIKENPFLLSSPDLSIDFQISDSIANEYQVPHNSPKRISAGLVYVLNHNLNNGHTCLPRNRLVSTTAGFLNLDIDTVEIELDEEIKYGKLFNYNENTEYIYLPDYYLAQQYIAGRLKLMLEIKPNTEQAVDSAIDAIEKENKINYASLQRDAIKTAYENNVFILTGGPGTGKTTTVNGIINVLEQSGKAVALAAPTGRAAKRLSEVTNHEAKTIHRLLEVQVGYAETGKIDFVHNEENPLSEDVIIIDEMSMIDTMLFMSLLKGIKSSAKLIMVGDFHQLPSVGAGNVLRDLIESNLIPTVELNEVFRQAALSAIVTNAHAIVTGEIPDLQRKDNDFFFISKNSSATIANTIVELCAKRLPKAYGFSPFDDIQVLCPSRKGDLGSQVINGMLQEKLNPPSIEKSQKKFGNAVFRIGDKVMQIKNNYDIEWSKDAEKGAGIFNGDIGVIKMVDCGSQTMAIDFDGRVAYYHFDMLDQLELAYAISIHKSQGSEFDAVIIPIFGGYDKLYFRNLLYTAVTRAKKLLILIGNKRRVEYMVNNNRRMLRYTGMCKMLKCMVNPFEE